MSVTFSELVRDSRLDVVFGDGHTYQHHFESGVEEVDVWKKQRTLGEGGGGIVWLEECVSGCNLNKLRAVKSISKPTIDDGNIRYRRELEAIFKFSQNKYRHCFVKSYGWFENDIKVFIAMEYFEHKDLEICISEAPVTENEGQQIVSQLTMGLQYMHTNGFAHRDLKPPNIFVVSRTPTWWVKIGDFGISKRAGQDMTALRTITGTPLYLAPELNSLQIRSQASTDEVVPYSYTFAIDLWCLGVVTYRILTLAYPFESALGLDRYTRLQDEKPWAKLKERNISQLGQSFIRELLAPRPHDRSTAVQASEHAWITKELGEQPPSASQGQSGSRTGSATALALVGPKPRLEPTISVRPARLLDNASVNWDTQVEIPYAEDPFSWPDPPAHGDDVPIMPPESAPAPVFTSTTRFFHTKTRAIEHFTPDSLPRHAVLSHTSWLPSTARAAFGELGLNKNEHWIINNACRQAESDGYTYIWAESYCIEKYNAAALSEALNSMFQRYQSAEICYVYLGDVASEENAFLPGSESAKSRWFEQGWSLPELIAPPNLIFFTKNWAKIGSKSTRSRELAEITGIDEDILTGTRLLDSVSVAKKMSWASKRKTSNREDIAYCLMGLFDISMTIRYGEGDKAFIRLQEKIMKNSDDHSLFAWKSPNQSSALSGLLATHPDKFADSGHIAAYRNSAALPPFLRSHRGLRIDLALSRLQPRNGTTTRLLNQHGQNVYAACLNCPGRKGEGFLGIYVKRLSSDNDQYGRVECSEFGQFNFMPDEIKTLYVPHKVIDPDLREHNVLQLRRGPGMDHAYKRIDIISNTGGCKAIEPSIPCSWIPGRQPIAFQKKDGATQLIVAILFERRKDNGQVAVLLSLVNGSDVGFRVARALPDAAELDSEHLIFGSHPLEQTRAFCGHSVKVSGEVMLRPDTKYIIVDISLAAEKRGPEPTMTPALPGSGWPESNQSKGLGPIANKIEEDAPATRTILGGLRKDFFKRKPRSSKPGESGNNITGKKDTEPFRFWWDQANIP